MWKGPKYIVNKFKAHLPVPALGPAGSFRTRTDCYDQDNDEISLRTTKNHFELVKSTKIKGQTKNLIFLTKFNFLLMRN
jgi:hypothetical protein